MNTQTLRYTDAAGNTFHSHLCLPEHAETTAAVLVFPEWWGLSEHAKHSAERLAQAGYAALAVDLYGNGVLTTEAAQAAEWMQQVLADPATLRERTDLALAQLTAVTSVDAARTAAIGFCFGGRVALDMARRGAAIRAAASFHGNLIPQVARAQSGSVSAALLVEHGGRDSMVSMDDVAAFRTEMDAAGADYHIDIFPEAHHGFTNPQATANGEKNGVDLAYDQAAAEQSWQNMLAFLAAKL